MTKQELKFWDDFTDKLSQASNQDAAKDLLSEMYKKYQEEYRINKSAIKSRIKNHEDAGELISEIEDRIFSTSSVYTFLHEVSLDKEFKLPYEFTDGSTWPMFLTKKNELRNMLESYVSAKEGKRFNKFGLWKELLKAKNV